MINNLKRIRIVGFVVLVLAIVSCQKKEAEIVPEKSVKVEKLDELSKYLSVSLGIELNQIQFNEANQFFFVPNTVFKMSLESVLENYESANEYKLNQK